MINRKMYIGKIENIRLYAEISINFMPSVWFMGAPSKSYREVGWTVLDKLIKHDYKVAKFLISKGFEINNAEEFDRQLKTLIELKFDVNKILIVKTVRRTSQLKMFVIPQEEKIINKDTLSNCKKM